MVALEIFLLRKWLVVVGLHTAARSIIQIVADVQGESAFLLRTPEAYRLGVGVLVLLSTSLPIIYFRLTLITLKSEKHLLAGAKKLVSWLPTFVTNTTEFPTVHVFNQQDGGVVVSAAVKKCNQATSVLIKTEEALPLTVSVEAGEASDQVTELEITHYHRFVRPFGNIFDEIT